MIRKSKIFAASLAVLSVSGVAHAQNSITLYGIAEYTIPFLGYVKTDQGNIWGNLAGSRWGMKGSEDLGGGLRAIFQLENGFNLGNGQSGAMFGRQAYVGLASNTLGTVTLGRQYDASVDMVQAISADNFGAAFSTPGDVDNNDNSLRQNNAIKYVSPSFGGLQFEGTYALGGVAGSVGQGYSYSGGVTFARGGLNLAATYFQATNPSTTTGAARTTWTGSADPLFDSVINNGYVSARTMAITQVGAQYVLGSLMFGGSYSNAQYRPDAQSTFATTQTYNSGKVFANYQLTPQFSMAAGYAYTSASGDTSAKYNQASIGADYLLSKRTDVYLQAAYQHASGTQRLADGSTQTAQASIGSYGFSGNRSQELLQVDFRHRF